MSKACTLNPQKEEEKEVSPLEAYLKARDAFVASLSDSGKAALRLQKERVLAALLEGRRRG